MNKFYVDRKKQVLLMGSTFCFIVFFALLVNTICVSAAEWDENITSEQMEKINEPIGKDAESLSYLTMDAEDLIERFKTAVKEVEQNETYQNYKNMYVINPNHTYFKEYFPNWTAEDYTNLDDFDKFCIYYLFYSPYSSYLSEWKYYDYSKTGETGLGDEVNAAYAEVNEWHRNNYEMYGVFINPFDDGVINETSKEEEKTDEEELQEIREEIAEELGVETKEGKYEKAWKDLLLSNIITIILIIAAVVIFIIMKKKHKQISND